MKRFQQKLFLILSIVSVGYLMSCNSDDNDPIIADENDPFDARLNNNSADSLSATVFLSDIDDGVINVRLSFTSEDNMNRVYTTINSQGQGEEKVDAGDAFGVDDKGDGSIDLSGDAQNGFIFDIPISTTGLPTEGTVVFKFWATSGKGDFRDVSKRLLVGPATLTIDLEGTNPAAILQEYTNIIRLEAPLGDATSETFISTLDGEVYKISEGEEFAAFWDFGFYYLINDGVSLASSADYPNLFSNPDTSDGLPLVNVNTFLGIEATEVNNAYFQLAPNGTDFDAFNVVNDLTFSITTADDETINNLAIGDVVYVLDQYGKKGILKVTDLVPSFGSDGFIEFDLKMQQ